jgi:hypothetical protein
MSVSSFACSNLKPLTDLLGGDVAAVKKVLNSCCPGRFDAELDKDGKAFRPDGGQAGTLIPPAFGLAGVNLHTWTGFGSVPYWNAYVGATEMHGSGTFFDRRLGNPDQYPVAAKSGSGNTRGTPDLDHVEARGASLLPNRHPGAEATRSRPLMPQRRARGKNLFNQEGAVRGVSRAAALYRAGQQSVLSPPRSAWIRSRPTGRRLICIARLRSRDCGRTRGRLHHDGRFATLGDVLEHYNRHLKLELIDREKNDLIEYLKSL